MTLIALHGFLGAPSDWLNWTAQDLGVENFIPCPVGRAESLEAWALAFNRYVAIHTRSPRTLMGYSMGGRLALQALRHTPSLWAQGILISTHPGLKTSHEKQNRLAHDQIWAKRFLQDPWEKLMQDWEAQPLFRNATQRFQRSEQDRSLLAEQLLNFSLGKQNYALPHLPLLWVTGEKDSFYCQHAQEICHTHSQSSMVILPGAGHRAPWEAPSFFSKQMVILQGEAGLSIYHKLL